eukprot:4310589-Pyramimonas_sp.AAC.1
MSSGESTMNCVCVSVPPDTWTGHLRGTLPMKCFRTEPLTARPGTDEHPPRTFDPPPANLDEHSRVPSPRTNKNIQRARRTSGRPPRTNLDLIPRSDNTRAGGDGGINRRALPPIQSCLAAPAPRRALHVRGSWSDPSRRCPHRLRAQSMPQVAEASNPRRMRAGSASKTCVGHATRLKGPQDTQINTHK